MKLLTALLLFMSLSAPAAKAAAVYDAHTEVELVSSAASVAPGAEFKLGVRFKLDPEWHIYWINAGDSGLAPKITWELPQGINATPLEWPYPRRIVQKPLVSYGYEGEVLLASLFLVSNSFSAQGPVTLKAKVSWLACKVDCIPGKAELSLTLPVEKMMTLNEASAPLFNQTRANLPLYDSGWKIQTRLAASFLLIDMEPPAGAAPLESVYFFPENNNLILHAAPQKLQKTPQGYLLEIPLTENHPKSLKALRGILVAEPGWRGNSKAIAVDTLLIEDLKAEPAVPESGKPLSLISVLFFAFLGGAILNLMPCVLPVLSLKILSFVKEAAENPKEVFKHGLAFTAGVLVSFWTLAGILILLKEAGRQIGWGFQLQSPEFLVVLIFIFFLFALNLFGVFEIGVSLTGAGQNLTRRKGFAGSFASGIFATVVATPCTAPFMGTALGFALAQPAVISFAVFSMLGLGMAMPYLILCMNRGLMKYVPKPGPWMVTLKQLLGFPLLATVIWLAWVLSLQKGTDAVLLLFAGLLSAAIGVWIFGKFYSGIAKILCVLLIALGIGISVWGTRGKSGPVNFSYAPSSNSLDWKPFSEEALAQLRKEGKPVFVDFTAAWCLTCQVNERTSLNTPQVVQAFRERGIIALKADWTSYDEKITQALARYGRNSIPLYVLYKPGSDNPEILPEILTPKIVLEAVEDLNVT